VQDGCVRTKGDGQAPLARQPVLNGQLVHVERQMENAARECTLIRCEMCSGIKPMGIHTRTLLRNYGFNNVKFLGQDQAALHRCTIYVDYLVNGNLNCN
jgi:hypothetical protein